MGFNRSGAGVYLRGSEASRETLCGPGGAGAACGPELVVSHSSVHARDPALVPVLNRASSWVYFGMLPDVEGVHHGGWMRLPIRKNGVPVVYGPSRQGLGPDSGSDCIEIPLSENWSAGRYRAELKRKSLRLERGSSD